MIKCLPLHIKLYISKYSLISFQQYWSILDLDLTNPINAAHGFSRRKELILSRQAKDIINHKIDLTERERERDFDGSMHGSQPLMNII